MKNQNLVTSSVTKSATTPSKKAPDGTPTPSASVEELKTWYRQALVIRRFEEESARAYSLGKIGGFLHLYIGQEAIAIGAVAALRDDDYALTSYRDHGLALARGVSSRACMAELFGKDTGCSRGLGGSMHMFDVSKHFYGGHAIVGGHVALGAGFAFTSKYKKEDRVAICFLGEGATNIGGFHEGMSLAALWKLPYIIVIENNEYAMGTSVERSSAVTNMDQKGLAYGMRSESIEAHDVRVVKDAIERAAAHARSGEGPTLIEARTYRFRGHSMSDPGKYRTPEEVEERKKSKDPVTVLKLALEMAHVSAQDIEAIDQSVEEEVLDAVKFADESPAALESSIHAFTYAE